MMVIVVSMYIYLFGLGSLICNRLHIMVMMLSLEMMTLGLFINVVLFAPIGGVSFLIMTMVVMVCEACLGLMLLVSLVFFYGSDLVKSVALVLA